jgi:hypothetical protein
MDLKNVLVIYVCKEFQKKTEEKSQPIIEKLHEVNNNVSFCLVQKDNQYVEKNKNDLSLKRFQI